MPAKAAAKTSPAASQRAAGCRARQPQQPVEKHTSRLVVDEMVGEDSGRLVGIRLAAAARPQMPDNSAERRCFADKPPTFAPRDQVNMDIGREHARRRPRRAARLDLRNRFDAGACEKRQKGVVEAVPRRRQDRERTGAEQGLYPDMPVGEIGRCFVR